MASAAPLVLGAGVLVRIPFSGWGFTAADIAVAAQIMRLYALGIPIVAVLAYLGYELQVRGWMHRRIVLEVFAALSLVMLLLFTATREDEK